MQRQLFRYVRLWSPQNVFQRNTQSNVMRAKFHTVRTQEVRLVKREAFPWVKITSALSLGGLLLYDGVNNNFAYSGATKRFLRSLQIATLISWDYIWVLYMENHKENYENLLKEVHLKSANRILNGCLLNGGLYIKVGQGVGAINHILPVEYTSTLSKLHEECLPSSHEDIRRGFLQDFGKLPEEVFQEFEYKPVAAASLAQVFKAKTKAGDDVAVKVQYLGLQQRFSTDLGTIIFLQDIIEFFFKDYNFGWICRNIRKNLEMELDFINEGRNAEKCAWDLKDIKYVYVPKVYWDLTKSRVLTMEWIDGYNITNLDMIQKDKLNLHDVDRKLFIIFAEQIFSSGFIHADPHPGNVFVRRKNGNAELILLDHGLYESLPRSIRLQLCKFWEATVLEDLETMKKTTQELNVQGYNTFAEILFQSPFQPKTGKLKTKLTDQDIAYMQEKAKHHFNEIMTTLKEMPPNMVLVVRNLNTIRAIAREHGDPIDRPKLMARYAQKCIFRDERALSSYFRWIFRRIRFEYCLIKQSIKLSLITLYLNVLYKLGRSPEKINIMEIPS